MLLLEQINLPEFMSDLSGRELRVNREGLLHLKEPDGVEKMVGQIYRDPIKGTVYHKREKEENIFRKFNAWTVLQIIGSRVNWIIYETDTTIYELESFWFMNCNLWGSHELEKKFVVPLDMWTKHYKEGKMKQRLNLFGLQWYTSLKEHIESPWFSEIGKKVNHARSTTTVFPEKDRVFRIFQTLSPQNVRVVILGQDPYYNGLADGFAFSSLKEDVVPESLKNIFKEIETDTGVLILDQNPNLERWVKQGVFLLNTCLTVNAGMPLSHKDFGWEKFTVEVIKSINDLNQPVAFILWGNHAKQFKKYLINHNHLVIESAHPSPLSASRGFFGSKPFSKVNEYLINNHQQPIDWR